MITHRQIHTALIVGLAMVPITSFALLRADRAERLAIGASAVSHNAAENAVRNATTARDFGEIANTERATTASIAERAATGHEFAASATTAGDIALAQSERGRRSAAVAASEALESAEQAERDSDERVAAAEVPDDLPQDAPTPSPQRRPAGPGFRMREAPVPFHVSNSR